MGQEPIEPAPGAKQRSTEKERNVSNVMSEKAPLCCCGPCCPSPECPYQGELVVGNLRATMTSKCPEFDGVVCILEPDIYGGWTTFCSPECAPGYLQIACSQTGKYVAWRNYMISALFTGGSDCLLGFSGRPIRGSCKPFRLVYTGRFWKDPAYLCSCYCDDGDEVTLTIECEEQ